MDDELASLSCRTLLSGCPTPLALLTGSGEVIACNPPWELCCGPPAGLLPRVHEDDRGTLSAGCTEALSASGPVVAAARMIASGGRDISLRWTLWRAGEATLWASVEVDRADYERQARILYNAFQQMDAVLWCCDRDGVLQVSEGSALAHAGLKPGQLVGQRIPQLYGEDSEIAGIVQRLLTGESIRTDNVTEGAHWLTYYTPFWGEDGKILGAQGVALHIPEDLPLATEGALLGKSVESLPIVLWAFDTRGVCTMARGGGLAQLGVGDEVGKHLDELSGGSEQLRRCFERAVAGEAVLVERARQHGFWRTRFIPQKDLRNYVIGVCAITENITEQRRAEEGLREQLRLTQEQQHAIASLSSPIIEVWQDVLVVPLIGKLEADRAATMMEGLLAAVVQKGAAFVILDFTGMELMDAATAQHLIKVIDAVALLGCRGVISGIRPSVAQTMVGLGLDLSHVRTLPTLKEALRWCMGAAG